MKKNIFNLILICLIFVATLNAQPPDKTKKPAQEKYFSNSAGTPTYQILNINNLTTWHAYDGKSNHSPGGVDGSRFPRNAAALIYQDGIIWGGKVFTDTARTSAAATQPIRVGGGTYGVGTKAGWINGTGASATAEPTTSAGVRIYRIRRDFKSMSETELKRDAAEFNEVTLVEVTSTQLANITAQYEKDWNEWPVSKGAPYIERNGIAGYQAPPTGWVVGDLIKLKYDEPGISGANSNVVADQVLWTVYNDLDETQAQGFVGSLPIGIECQKTVWGYKNSGTLGDVYFTKYKLVNKGGAVTNSTTKGTFTIDSMYVCQWSDPDLGTFTDDLVGCDPTLNMGFVYNANATDVIYKSYGYPPPAAGYDFLQGPAVTAPLTDSGIVNFQYRRSVKNLGMSSFAYFAGGSPYSDPPGGASQYDAGSGRWWKILRGFAPLGTFATADAPYATGPLPVTNFPLSGDPVNGIGFLDGQGQNYSFAPGDRRLLINTGPFRMKPDESQEIVIGTIFGMGSDRLSSVAVMKFNDQFAQSSYDKLLSNNIEANIDVEYPEPTTAKIKIEVNAKNNNISSLNAVFKKNSNTSDIVSTVQLYDDGSHYDLIANDETFSNTVSLIRVEESLNLDILAVTKSQQTITLNNVAQSITIAGLIEIDSIKIISDNYNGDRIVNPGENIIFTPYIKNKTQFTLDNIKVSMPFNFIGYREIIIPSLNNGIIYSSNDPVEYWSFNIPKDLKDTTLKYQTIITDNKNNIWQATIPIVVKQPKSETYNSSLNHFSGRSSWDFDIKVVDDNLIKNNNYKITISDSGSKLNLINLTTGYYLLVNHAIPDEYGHNMPITEGFKIVPGKNWGKVGIKLKDIFDSQDPSEWGWNWASGERFLTWAGGADGLKFESFKGALGYSNANFYFGYSTTMPVTLGNLKNVELRFADVTVAADGGMTFDPAGENVSFAYRYVRAGASAAAKPEFAAHLKRPWNGSYGWNDFEKSAPLAAYDMDATPPRRLTIGYLENNVAGGLVNGKYTPPLNTLADNTATTGPREWLWISDRTYSETLNPADTLNALQNPMLYYYFATWALRNTNAWKTTDRLLINVNKTLTENDTWIFNPTIRNFYEKPSLSYPTTNAVNIAVNDTMKWRKLVNATSYKLQISLVKDFATLIKDLIAIDTTKYVYGMHNGTKYYWRVRGTNQTGDGPWAVDSFKTINSPNPKLLFVSISENKLQFAATKVGTTRDSVITIKNTGDDTLKIVKISTDTTLNVLIASNKEDNKRLKRSKSNITTVFSIETEKLKKTTESLADEFSVDPAIFVIAPGSIKNVTIKFTPSKIGLREARLIYEYKLTESTNKKDTLLVNGIGIVEPATVTLNYPSTNAVNVAINETFKWRKLENAINYKVQISFAKDFVSTTKESITSDTTIYISGLQNNLKYYWRVRGINPAGEGPWSVDSFKTINTPNSRLFFSSLTNNKINYTETKLGTSKDSTIVITNIGDDTLYVFDIFIDTALYTLAENNEDFKWQKKIPTISTNIVQEFTIESPVKFKLSPGVNTTSTIRFTPQYIGNRKSKIIYISQKRDYTKIYDTLLASGFAFGTPAISLNPKQLDFGSIKVNSMNLLTFELKNTGTDTMKLNEIFSTNPESFKVKAQLDSLALPPGSHYKDTIKFTPKRLGSHSANIKFKGKMIEDSIFVKGIATGAAKLKLSLSKIEFKTVKQHISKDTTFTITNYGDDTLRFGMRVNPPQLAGNFIIMDPLPIREVKPSDSIAIPLRFSPNPIFIGNMNGTLNISANTNPPNDSILLSANVVTSVPYGTEIPTTYSLSQNFPNPFNPTTTIRFGLPNESDVRIEIYNSLGQLIETLVDERLTAHFYEVKWETGRIPSGLYFYKITATDVNNPSNKFISVKKMILMK